MPKKLLSMVLAICMVAGILQTLSVTVSAADTGSVAPGYINDNFNADDETNDIDDTLLDVDNNDAADLSVDQPTPSNLVPGTDKEVKLTEPSNTEGAYSEVADDSGGNRSDVNNSGTANVTPILLTPSSTPDVTMMISSAPTVWDGVMPTANSGYTFSGGDGTKLEPYLISSAADLAQLSANVKAGTSYSGKYFEMTADITLNENVLADDGTLNNGTFYPWTPIGISDNLHFAGNFDGNHHTISGVYINPTEISTSDKYQGLFGCVKGTTINDIAVVGSYIQGYSFIGGVVGYLSSGKLNHCSYNGHVSGTNNIGGVAGYGVNVTILNCDNHGLVSGNGKYVGGVVGYNHTIGKPPSRVMNCRNGGSVTGSSNVGGVVGYSTTNISITNCSNSGNISGADCIGSIVGRLTSGCLENSWNEGSVSGNSEVGGIVGHNKGTVTNCQNSGSISAGNHTGGIVGFNYGTIRYCCNTGSVNGGNYVGGLVGYNIKSKDTDTCLVQYCYNTGGLTPVYKTGSGGCVGHNASGSVANCYYDKQMCMLGGIKNADYTGQAEGKLTLDMVGQNLCSGLGEESNWTFADSLYPRLAGIDCSDAAHVSATPVFLSDGDTVAAISADFAVGTGNNVTWVSDNTDVININGGSATVTRQESDTDVILTASKNDVSRTVGIKVSAQDKPSASIKLQLANITVVDKTYDKSVEADYTVAGTIGLKLKSDETEANNMADVSLSGTPVITFCDANAGQNKNVNVTGVSLTGTKAAFYELDFSNLTGTISPKPVRLSWTDHSSFVYDNTEKSISAAITNALVGDAVTVTSYSGTISATDAGAYTAAATTLSDSNYTLTGGNGISNEWAILAATPAITLADKTVTKTGYPITIDAAVVTGVAGGKTPDGAVTYTYYTDSACTTLTYVNTENAGTAPVDVGTYYVKATIAASGNYGANTSPAATLTIKEQPVYSVSGTALNDAAPAAALSGTTIRVMSGTTQVGLTATTAADGSFVIYGIPSGTYNLVANYGEKTVTKIITVENANLSLASSIVMPSIIRNSILVVTGTRTPDVVVGGLDTESDNTPAERSVIITLTVAENESSTNANDVARTAASNGNKVGMILDIDLSRTVDGTSDPNYNKTSALLEIIIPLPVELQRKPTYRVYRYHKGSVDTITTTANRDGEHITVNADKTEITLYANKFSTYAIGYTEPCRHTGRITSYTITATANEGGTMSPTFTRVTAGKNKTFTITANKGYHISDVLVDGQSVGAVSSYTFSNVRAKHTIETFFALDKASWVCPFADVDKSDWFYSAVEYVNVNELMNGVNETSFAPDLKTTRAMIVTILWRMEGQPETKELSSFTDIKDGAWYVTAIHWAAENKIVKGYDNGSFDPSGNLTREQLATILYRYAQYKGYDVSVGEDTNILSYHDAFDISEYAIPAIQWACSAGLINGRTENTLVPQGSATRAETAALLQRFGDNCTSKGAKTF